MVKKKESKFITWLTIGLSIIGVIALVLMALRVIGII